jgi:hypothetical protein
MLCVALLGLAGLSSSALASDAEWTYVTEGITKDGVPVRYFFDRNSLRIRRDGLVQAWTLDNFKAPVRLPLKKDAGKRARSVVSLEVFDCSEKKSGMQQSTYYSGPRGTGHSVSGFDDPSPPDLRAFQPESIGEAVIEKICEAASAR